MPFAAPPVRAHQGVHLRAAPTARAHDTAGCSRRDRASVGQGWGLDGAALVCHYVPAMSTSTPTEGEPPNWPFRALALRALRRYFSLDRFRPGQEAALAAITSGRDLLTVMPTGSGKSLCYQLPAVLRPGVILVISPLIALMKEQVDRLRARGIQALQLSSALSPAELRGNEARIAERRASLVYLSPEKLRSRRVRALLGGNVVWLVAVDEAHCISTWGHDFRPQYRLIGDLLGELGRPTVAAFTATATERTKADIVAQLRMQDPVRVELGYDRPELRFEVRYAEDDADKLDILAEVIAEAPGSVIVYCGTRRLAEMVADFLKQMLAVAAEPYHAGMAPTERTRVQEAFLSGETRVVAATSAFGLGIDKPDIRAVVHYCFPGSLEEYYQGVGRAGRDGQPARCPLIFCDGDDAIHEYLMNSDMPPADVLDAVYAALPGEGWLNHADIAERVNRSAELVDDAIWQLALLGCLSVEDVAFGRAYARKLPLTFQSVTAQYVAHTDELRRVRRLKIAAVRAYAHSRGCRRTALLEYLGEAAEPRGRCCDVCDGRAGKLDPVEELIIDCVRNMRTRVGRTTVADILRGSRSKKVKRLGGDGLPHYGELRAHTRNAVLGRLDLLVQEGVLAATPGPYSVVWTSDQGPPGRTRAPRSTRRGLGRAFLQRSELSELRLGRFTGWVLTSYFAGSGSNRTEIGQLLWDFKYRERRDCGPPLADRLLAMIRSRDEFSGAEALVPVPRTTTERAFDPSAELARDVADQGGPAALLGVLTRSRETPSQKELHTREGRRQNVQGAFEVPDPARVANRRLILVDDFVDSGATMEAAARALSDAGAEAVVLLAVARTYRRW